MAPTVTRPRTGARRNPVRGVVLAAPLLALCFLAVYDAVIFVESRQRLARAALSLAQSLAASGRPAEVELSRLPAVAARAAGLANADQVGIVASVASSADAGTGVLWQRRVGAAFDMVAPAAMAATGGADADPHGADPPGANPGGGRLYVVVEVVSPPDPWLIAWSLFGGWLGDWPRGRASASLAPARSTRIR